MGEKSPSYSMEDCYKVLKYLPEARVDRQEPLNLNSKSVVRSNRLVLPTLHHDFNGTDMVYLYINCQGIHIDLSKLSLSFSPLRNGNAKVLSLNPRETEIDYDNETVLSFTLDRNNTARDKTRELTGIESIVFDFEDDANGVEILKFVMRSYDYTYTLSDIQNACENGENYVLRRLNDMSNEKEERRTIPELLQQYIYMAAGAYAWITRWEYEAKPMKEPKSESNNYADRLFGQVDDAIKKYLSNIENNRDEEYVQMHLFRAKKSKW